MRRECERGETMKVVEYKDGKTNYRVMTPEEVAELERMHAQMPEPVPDPSDARMTEIEAALIELAAMIGGDA